MYQIRIHIAKDGQTQVKVEGYQGPSCLDLSRPFTEALGKIVADEPTAEYWATVAQNATQTQ